MDGDARVLYVVLRLEKIVAAFIMRTQRVVAGDRLLASIVCLYESRPATIST